MADLKYEELLRNCVVDNKIKPEHLVHIPKLKDCEHWEDVVYLGRVTYQFKFTKMDGGLIKYHGRIFYITAAQITPLAQLYKWKNINNTITVL